MKQPYLNPLPSTKSTVDVFGGYNHNLRIGENEFYDTQNTTADYYPLLSPRAPRGVYARPEHCTGIIAKEKLCYVCGSEFVIGDEYIEMGLSDEPKSLISMGAYVIIMPDKKYINVTNIEDRGDIEAAFSGVGEKGVRFSLSTPDGTTEMVFFVQETAPDFAKASGSADYLWYWIDNSKAPYTINMYSSTTGAWSEYESALVRIDCTGIGKSFEVGDGVVIDGFASAFVAEPPNPEIEAWNVKCDALSKLEEKERTVTVMYKGDDYIIVTGLVPAMLNVFVEAHEGKIESFAFAQSEPISISRRMPNLDFIIESNNRLWGCRYGKAANDEFVNEIYASKLGDFKNWNSFRGIASDSWVVSVGSDGPFTGAVTHGGYPLFFKENMLYKVYGSYPSEYQISDLPCRGIAPGSAHSCAIVNEVLYYHSRHGVCAYDGSLPVCVSDVFGEVRYKNAVGGVLGNKYYVSLQDGQGEWHLFVYDTLKRLWHREDNTKVSAFAAHSGMLYYLDAADGTIKVIGGSEYGCKAVERKVKWYADTGVIGTDSARGKYILKLAVRMSLDIGSIVRFYIEYDSSGTWESAATVMGWKLDTFTFPVLPRRCDHLRLRIEGEGDAKIYSITKTIREGSEH